MAIEQLTYKEALLIERNQCQAEIAQLDIDIAILEKQDPNAVVARKKLTPNSFTEITTKDFLPQKTKERELKQVRSDAIDVLLSKNNESF